MTQEERLAAIAALLEVVARLRGEGGCPWDRQQTIASMAPHLLEEAFEAADAARRGADAGTCEELGDVLINLLMIGQIASESERFDAGDIARGAAEKLVRRHPHVFGSGRAGDAEEVLRDWETIKRSESDHGGAREGAPRGALSGVPVAMPALLRAFRVGQKAARVGFDWPDPAGPRAKVDEELAELDAALRSDDAAAATAELGDVLFSICNLARHHGLEPEFALRGTVDRFCARFAVVEARLGARLANAELPELEAAWQAAKREVG